MKISELKANMSKVDVEIEIKDMGEVRQFAKFGNPGRVCTAIAKDDTGEIVLTLWNDEVDKVKKGDKVRITNGYIKEFQGKLQLSAGRFGKIETITS